MISYTAICLARRMKELREKNGVSMDEMAKLLNKGNKSTVSRVESAKVSESSTLEFAKKYCNIFKLDEKQTENFLRGARVVIPDTSALLSNPQLINLLNKTYGTIVVPDTVLYEINKLKNYGNTTISRKAWEVLSDMGNKNNDIVSWFYGGDNSEANNDMRIIWVARDVARFYNCRVDIISNDVDYSAYLRGSEEVKAVHLAEFMANSQDLPSTRHLEEIDQYFALNYDDIDPPNEHEVNAYLPNGNTLIISTIRDRRHNLQEKMAKIRWLIAHGADVNACDCSRRYFPPLSHAIQVNNFELFVFLLKECNANPNRCSRDPRSSGKVRQKNEGNTPLMVAAWEGKDKFVRALCLEKDISLNQQDGNGFTALIKACANLNRSCMDILLNRGADPLITDINGKNYIDHLNEAISEGPLVSRPRNIKPSKPIQHLFAGYQERDIFFEKLSEKGKKKMLKEMNLPYSVL